MTTEINNIGRVEMKHPRVEYFAGQFLEDKDFQTEQKYHLMRRRQLNQELFSHGVRRGFSLKLEGARGKAVRVDVGAAIDVRGYEIWLDEEIVWNFPVQTDGEYFLCMQALEVQDAEESYSVATEGSSESGSGGGSPWVGYTRSVDTIEFSLMKAKPQRPSAAITLAKIRCREGVFSAIDTSVRDISVTKIGNGLSINLVEPGHYIEMEYKGEPNAYIGPNLDKQAPDCVTFSSRSKRMHLAGEEDLYLLNKKGVVVSNAWGAAGSLTVEGKAQLKGGLDVTQAVDIQGSLKVKDKISFAGAELKTRDDNSGVIFDSHANDLYLHGQKVLYISNKNGVVIAKDEAGGGEGKAGSLHVQGMTYAQEGLTVTHGKQGLTINGKSDVTIEADTGRVSLNAKGKSVIVGEQSGSLHVQGMTYAQEGLTVTHGKQGLTINGKSDVTIEADTGRVSLNAKGKSVIVGEQAGSLHVQGMTYAQEGLTVTHGKQGLTINGKSDVTIEADAGRVYLNAKGKSVIVGEQAGSLHVQGMTYAQEGLTVTHGKQGLTINGKSDVTIEADAGRVYLNAKGKSVIVGEQAGSLHVQGMTYAQEGLTVTHGKQGLTIDGKSDVTIEADTGRVYLNAKGKSVIVGEQAGSLHVQGMTHAQGGLSVSNGALISDLVMHSLHSNQQGKNVDTKRKLTKDGDFLFFVEPIGGDNIGFGNLIIYWRIDGKIRSTAIAANLETK